MPKINHFIAIHDGGIDQRHSMWDMLRYDSCYPISNAPDGWIILVQPHRDGIKGGFTLARWESFDFRNTITDTGFNLTMPTTLREKLRLADERRTKP